MKAHVQTICFLSFAAFSMVSGQLGPAALPDCAKPCAATLPAECKSTDFKCICGSSTWITGISCCVMKACSAADQQKTIDVANSLCSLVGVTLPSVATCPSMSSAAPASTSTPSSSSATSAALKQSSTASSGSATSAASKASSSGSATSAASKQSSSSSATAGQASATATTGSSASPASTGAAGHLNGQGIGAAGVAALALAFI